MFMSIVLWAQVTVFTHVISDDVDDWDRWFLGRAPRTRETLPDFRESCRVARHSRVFRWLMGSQRTPGNGASHAETPQYRHPHIALATGINFASYLVGIRWTDRREI